jgi:hypothetical protein
VRALSVSLALVICLLFGCTSRQERMNSSMNPWVGQHQDDLLRQWGPPTQEIRLSNGGSILSYTRGKGQVFAPMGNAVIGMPRSCRQDFETDSGGTILIWRYEGQC